MKVDVKVPAVGESVTEGTVAEWLKKNGDYVQRDEVLVAIETDKASVEVVAEQAVQLQIKVEAGTTVKVGDVLGVVDTSAASTASASSAASQANAPAARAPTAAPTSAPAAPSAKPSTSNGHAGASADLSPAVRRLVSEHKLDTSTLSGSGRGGRITKEDVVQQMTTPAASGATGAPAGAGTLKLPTMPLRPDHTDRGERRVKMTTIRKKIAERLMFAQNNAAILTTFNEIDMTTVMQLRNQYKDKFKEKYGVNLGFMGFFVKACVEALRTVPEVNAWIDGQDMVYHDFVNMSVAVGTDRGLVVPVIKNADMLTMAEVELTIREFAVKAKENKLTVDDFAGGTKSGI